MDNNTKVLNIRFEIYEDIPTSDFEQLLLEALDGIVDCTYEIMEG